MIAVAELPNTRFLKAANLGSEKGPRPVRGKLRPRATRAACGQVAEQKRAPWPTPAARAGSSRGGAGLPRTPGRPQAAHRAHLHNFQARRPPRLDQGVHGLPKGCRGLRCPLASRASLPLEIPRATALRQQSATRRRRARSLPGVVVRGRSAAQMLLLRMRQIHLSSRK